MKLPVAANEQLLTGNSHITRESILLAEEDKHISFVVKLVLCVGAGAKQVTGRLSEVAKIIRPFLKQCYRRLLRDVELLCVLVNAGADLLDVRPHVDN